MEGKAKVNSRVSVRVRFGEGRGGESQTDLAIGVPVKDGIEKARSSSRR